MARFSVILLGACAVFCGGMIAQAAIPESGQDKLFLFMKAALDRDCDGELKDETEEDRAFSTRKSLRPQECVIYRTEYRNDGSFPIRHLRVTNQMPGPMSFITGSTQFLQTPPGLRPGTPLTPATERGGELIWRFDGALAPGERGEIQFRAKLTP